MMDAADARDKLIRHLEDALALADEINDGTSLMKDVGITPFGLP
jgi:hypothetical protein